MELVSARKDVARLGAFFAAGRVEAAGRVAPGEAQRRLRDRIRGLCASASRSAAGRCFAATWQAMVDSEPESFRRILDCLFAEQTPRPQFQRRAIHDRCSHGVFGACSERFCPIDRRECCTAWIEPNSSNIQGDPDGLFDGGVRPILAVEKKRLSREKWWLCEKARTGAAMLLSCMHQEWMAQVDGACVACRQYLTPRSGFSKTLLSDQISQR